MGKRRGRPRGIDGDVEQAIAGLAQTTPRTAAQIGRELRDARKHPDLEGRVPANDSAGDRQMRRAVEYYRAEDSTGPWTLAQATGDEAAAILPALGAALERSQGQLAGFTQAQAALVLKVAKAASDLAPYYIWRIAASYQAAEQKDRPEDAASLEALLALRPWASREAMERFWRWVRHYRLEWWGMERRPSPVDEVQPGKFGVSGDVYGPPAGGLRPKVAGVAIALEIEKDLGKESQHD